MSKATNMQSPEKQNLSAEDAIIVFIKNPQLGKVKTRLAATVGNEQALTIYHTLMQHTRAITGSLIAEKYLYYSDFIDYSDIWENDDYQKLVQLEGQDLGLKMASAFHDTLQKKHKKALIIGSDCLELTEELINQAYDQLSDNETVIGPAVDGGYYLIGFNFELIAQRSEEVLNQVFLNKTWSHESVGQEALAVFERMNLTFFELPTLTDVDEEKDYLKTRHLAQKLGLECLVES